MIRALNEVRKQADQISGKTIAERGKGKGKAPERKVRLAGRLWCVSKGWGGSHTSFMCKEFLSVFSLSLFSSGFSYF